MDEFNPWSILPLFKLLFFLLHTNKQYNKQQTSTNRQQTILKYSVSLLSIMIMILVVFGFSSLLIVHAVCFQCSSHSAYNVEARRLQDIELTITSSDYRRSAEPTGLHHRCIISYLPSTFFFIIHL